ncbi:hypothetical protein BP6252_12928 [Coleophoma cylindrospora]|uniref:2EXR domain-containing protein n=1 Tax=Coleophoma cylindrospora TaxID=1849047 RepID=A0A3D8QDQ5_9HELO|nr:hypothetical protein BP6252_12928 [Coleophoma cylindrospora]
MTHLDRTCMSVKAELLKIKQVQEKEKSKALGNACKTANLRPASSCLFVGHRDNPYNEFRGFDRLPYELREAVWEYALKDCQQRVFEVEWDDAFSRWIAPLRSRNQPHSFLSTNLETRTIYLRKCIRINVYAPAYSRRKFMRNNGGYFYPDTDVLYLSMANRPQQLQLTRKDIEKLAPGDDLAKIASLAVSYRWTLNKHAFWGPLESFSQIENLAVVMHDHYHQGMYKVAEVPGGIIRLEEASGNEEFAESWDYQDLMEYEYSMTWWINVAITRSLCYIYRGDQKILEQRPFL